MNDLEQSAIVGRLNGLILKAAPTAKTVSKYGGTLYTLKPDQKEGQFCGIFEYKGHVQLAFSQGTQLSDPKHLLEGSGKYRRHVNVKTEQEIDETSLVRLVKQAAKISI